MFARRETIRIVSQWVAFVVVGYGVRKVHRVRGVSFERVFQFDVDAFSAGLYVGRFKLWRRNHNVFRGVFYFDKFVKAYV